MTITAFLEMLIYHKSLLIKCEDVGKSLIFCAIEVKKKFYLEDQTKYLSELTLKLNKKIMQIIPKTVSPIWISSR